LSTKNKTKAITANLIAPGVGQLFQKRFLSGVMYLLASICAIMWLCISFIQIMINVWRAAMNNKPIEYHWTAVIIPFSAIVVIWVISYIDIFVFAPPDNSGVSDDKNS